MRSLIRIGYWQSEHQPGLPHPSRLVDPSWDADERDLTVEYLRGGLPVVHMMGYSPCRMCDLKTNGTSELTDGTYLWPQGLAHYVEEHQVRLPSGFLAHAKRRFLDLEDAAYEAHRGGLDLWLQMTE